MRPQKSLKIDLSKEYPCPCRRRGRLLPILLTDAFGCDRCQQIFVVDEKNQIIEQLSSNYPGKRAWRWTGYRWIAAGFGDSGLPFMLVMLLATIVIVLALALRSLPSIGMIWAAIVVGLIFSIVVLMSWLANRH
ncbi:hypothetical protein NIES593_06740 [Hydrococcus rivularis NIES-593]|uniref:Uncharacterized protein n=1 Tax=Hydrococcus rivularis NIES-593 TaxID=1921803 RepID=A0A1U7HN10_9CYAN|nr:hypothetical protein [Hydrococcus rivularis]OKH24905.1 hypothetical protein NIES593_06740 [Hydrococcus rivularis NIES-593]